MGNDCFYRSYISSCRMWSNMTKLPRVSTRLTSLIFCSISSLWSLIHHTQLVRKTWDVMLCSLVDFERILHASYSSCFLAHHGSHLHISKPPFPHLASSLCPEDGSSTLLQKVHFTYLFNHCLSLSHFPKPWKGPKAIMLKKPSKDPKCPQNLCLISSVVAS